MSGEAGLAAEDEDHFEASVLAHLPALKRFAVALSGLDEAEDLVQDTLTLAWQRRDQYDPARGTERSWLLGILYNTSKMRRRRLRNPHTELTEQIASGQRPPDGLDLDLQLALRTLPRRQRHAIYLFYYVRLTVEEIAHVMTCSSGTVKSTLSDARKSLAKTLGDDYDH